MKLIDKDAVVAEIQRLHNAHSGKYGCDEVGINLEYLEDFLDTLEVKEVQEPVSEDLEEAANQIVNKAIQPLAQKYKDGTYVGGIRDYFSRKEFIELVKAGAEWQKEQMTKDAGYEWDAEKKELKTIEQKPAWSEEDDIKALNRISAILVDASEVKNWWKQYRLIERDEMIRLTDFLKSLKERYTSKSSNGHYELEQFAGIVRGNLTGISKDVQSLFEDKYLQLTGNRMYRGCTD